MIIDSIQRALKGEPLTTAEQVYVRSMLALLISALAVSIGIIYSALQSSKVNLQTALPLALVGGLAVLFHGIAAALKNSPDITDQAIAPVVDQEATVLDTKFADLEKGVDPNLQNTGIQKAIDAQLLATTGLIVPQGPVTNLINPAVTNAMQGQTQVTGS